MSFAKNKERWEKSKSRGCGSLAFRRRPSPGWLHESVRCHQSIYIIVAFVQLLQSCLHQCTAPTLSPLQRMLPSEEMLVLARDDDPTPVEEGAPTPVIF